MATAFDRLEAVATRTLAGVFGERWRFDPMATPANGRAGADPARAVTTIVGTKMSSVEPVEIEVSGRASDDLPKRTASLGAIVVDRAVLAYDPVRGDRMTSLDRAGAPVYRVYAVEPDGPSRWRLLVAQIGGAE